MRVPQDFARASVIRHDVAARIAREEQTSGGGQHAVANVAPKAGITVTPRDFAGLVIDRRKERAERAETGFILAAETHGASRIGLREVVHGVGVVLGDVEQAGIGRVRGRRPVGGAAVVRGDE